MSTSTIDHVKLAAQYGGIPAEDRVKLAAKYGGIPAEDNGALASQYGEWQDAPGGVTPTPSKAGQLFDKAATTFVHNEPAIGMTLGGIAGNMVAGPVGGIIGAGYGGAVGESARGRAEGHPATAKKILEGAAIGAGGELGGIGLGKGVGAAYRWLRPSASERIVPIVEAAARKLTNAINPNPLEADQFINNAA
ncbi:MAG: hypothetical protein ACP5EP_13255, partial [Acidobacteriaceae bacterium]